jgi:hypothetical protein
MGSHRIKVGEEYSDNDLVDVLPHSGNIFFFSGVQGAEFDTIMFLTGQKNRDLFGSPLVLLNSFSPNLTI